MLDGRKDGGGGAFSPRGCPAAGTPGFLGSGRSQEVAAGRSV
ncbi:hypothetical protein EE612_044486, partial [Oryza sativa]